LFVGGGGGGASARRGEESSRRGTKRARAAAAGLPASLGFAALGGGAMEEVAVAAAEGGME
jgi:hypothetical protein